MKYKNTNKTSTKLGVNATSQIIEHQFNRTVTQDSITSFTIMTNDIRLNGNETYRIPVKQDNDNKTRRIPVK